MDLNYERSLVVNDKTFQYSGLFRVDDLLDTINKVITELGYTRREKKSEELVIEEGKKVFIELRPYKQKGNVQLQLAIRITLDHLKDTVEEVKGHIQKLQVADVHIAIDAWFLADDEFENYMAPWRYFVRSLISKYIVDISLHRGLPDELTKDAATVYARIKQLLNSYTQEKFVKPVEQDIIGSVAEEIKELAK
ncbi:hypothetical protein HOC32_00160 [Candidatus Woesearchaeota archaeon]|nr:hypothetical protein [Candidatus Woesearchaeota archaeon]